MANLAFRRGLKAVAALADPTRRKLYGFVARQTDAVSRDDVANAIGVTRAMAAFHLDKLVDAGLLRPEYRRLFGRAGPGAGRPSKLYRRSRRRFDVTIPTRDHQLLSGLLARALSPGPDASSPEVVGHDYGNALGATARRRITGRRTDDRLIGCLEDVLADLGFEPTRSSGGEVWARNCPFDPVSRRFPSVVCSTAVAVVRGLIDGLGGGGMRVRREERSGWCCVIAAPAASDRAAIPR